jgi:hypothetical protein
MRDRHEWEMEMRRETGNFQIISRQILWWEFGSEDRRLTFPKEDGVLQEK